MTDDDIAVISNHCLYLCTVLCLTNIDGANDISECSMVLCYCFTVLDHHGCVIFCTEKPQLIDPPSISTRDNFAMLVLWSAWSNTTGIGGGTVTDYYLYMQLQGTCTGYREHQLRVLYDKTSKEI